MQKFNTKALTGDISPNDKFLSKLEVKKAYREMAKKYHPDKIQSNDEALKKGA